MVDEDPFKIVPCDDGEHFNIIINRVYCSMLPNECREQAEFLVKNANKLIREILDDLAAFDGECF